MLAKVVLISLGCSKNLVDSEQMLYIMEEHDIGIVNNIDDADFAIINTCGFIEAAKQEAIDNILEVCSIKSSGGLKGVIVTGCLTQRYQNEFFNEIPEVDAILGTGSYSEIYNAISAVMNGEKFSSFNDINKSDLSIKRRVSTPRHTAFLKIAEGCDHRCSFCVIPSLRGKYRSRNIEDILIEAKELESSGVKEVIIIAQDITRYGLDLYKSRRLPELLNELCKMDFEWIRLHYLYPDELNDTLISTIKSQPKILKYFDIPIQHINDRLLRAMRRRSNRALIEGLISKIRNEMPEAVIRTSIIVGLPGETDEDFMELCNFLRESRLERVGVFTYSMEEGSEAYSMDLQVEDDEKLRRQRILEEIQSETLDIYNTSCFGKTIRVVCEGYSDGMYYGRSYAESPDIDGVIHFKSDNEPNIGEFIDVVIENSSLGELYGRGI